MSSSFSALTQPNNNTTLYVVIALVSIVCCFCILSSCSGLIYYMFFSEEFAIANDTYINQATEIETNIKKMRDKFAS